MGSSRDCLGYRIYSIREMTYSKLCGLHGPGFKGNNIQKPKHKLLVDRTYIYIYRVNLGLLHDV